VSTPRGYYRIGGRHTAPLPTPLPPRGGEGVFLSWRGTLQTTPLWITQGLGVWGIHERGSSHALLLGGGAPLSGVRGIHGERALHTTPWGTPGLGVRGIHGEEGDGSRPSSWVPGRSWIVWGSPPLHGLTTPHKAVP